VGRGTWDVVVAGGPSTTVGCVSLGFWVLDLGGRGIEGFFLWMGCRVGLVMVLIIYHCELGSGS
jgi:hypothetical protein